MHGWHFLLCFSAAYILLATLRQIWLQSFGQSASPDVMDDVGVELASRSKSSLQPLMRSLDTLGMGSSRDLKVCLASAAASLEKLS